MRWLVLIYGGIAYLLGIRSLVYFVGFASNFPLVRTVDSGPAVGWPQALAVDAALLVAFALPHSLMARSSFKRAFSLRLPEAMSRSTYTLVAALLLSLLMWQWRPLGAVVWEVDPPAAGMLISIAVFGWVLAAIAYYSIGHLDLLGLRQAYRYFAGAEPTPGYLVTTGVYRYLRNPMYVGFALGMWSTPRMTVGHLLLAAALSVYVLIGLRYERRDLAARFGERYLAYLGEEEPGKGRTGSA